MNVSALAPLTNHYPEPSPDDLPGIIKTAFTLERSGRERLDASAASNQRDQAAIYQFAQDNGFQYTPTDPSLIANVGKEYNATPAWFGFAGPLAAKNAYHVTRGTLHGYGVTMFILYEHLSNGTSHEHPSPEQIESYTRQQSRGIVRVKLPKLFPQIVLDSNKNDPSATSSVWVTYKNNQLLSLEGNFAQYFDLYVPKGLQIDALSLLAPNFMELLMNHARAFDVEFYGDEMIFITKQPLYTAETMQLIDQALLAQLEYLNRTLSHWNYTPTVQPFDRLQKAALSGATIKIGPFRLTPLVLLTLIVVGFIAIGLFANLMNRVTV